MGKYSNKYKKGQNRPNNKKKRPGKLPVYLGMIPPVVFVLYVLLSYPDYTANSLMSALIACFVLYMLLLILWRIYYRHKLAGSSIRQIDKMSGEEFELFLATMYKKHGFEVKLTPKTCDFGADLLLKDPKSGLKICVQAKRYRNLVGEEAVQQTLSGREYYKCDKAMIITNSHYTDAAKKLAKSCGIAMIDRYSLGSDKMYDFGPAKKGTIVSITGEKLDE